MAVEEKEKLAVAASEPNATDDSKSKAADEEFEAKLASLPEQYREAILRQYDIPDTKMSLLGVLRYATPFEILLMIVGAILSIAAGTRRVSRMPQANCVQELQCP
jgi:hypothetical protein